MAQHREPTEADYLFAWGPGVDPANPLTGAVKGHGNDVAPWRKPVTDDPWPFTPDNCGYADYGFGWWDRAGEHLICAGCGLDCT